MPATDSSVTRNATVVLAVIASGAAMVWMAGILTPLALAVFLAVMIDGFARVMEERAPGFPKPAALPVAIILSIVLFGLSAYVIAQNGAGFAARLMTYGPRLDTLLAQGAHAIHIKPPPPFQVLLQRLNVTPYLGAVAQGLQSSASTLILVLIYLGFIIASRRLFRRKIVALFPHHTQREKAALVFQRIRDAIESYLWIQTVTGLMIAVASWAVMAALGLDNAFFWAFLIFVVSYVPIVGGAIGILLPPLFALLQFPHWWEAAVLLGALQAINFVVGNIVLPRMQGQTLNMDPVVLMLSLAFWGAIWGLPGMFLSTPLTVMVMVVLAQFEGSRWIAVLLSGDGQPQGMGRHPPGTAAGHDPLPKPPPAKAPPRPRKRPPVAKNRG